MKTRVELENTLASQWQTLHDAYRVRRIGIFGSRARGDETPVSDVDILVELEGPVGWEIVDLHHYLEDLLGVRVDLLTQGAVKRKPLLWESIQKDLAYIET